MTVVIPDHATWVRFPRFVGDAAMQLPVLRLLREIGAAAVHFDDALAFANANTADALAELERSA